MTSASSSPAPSIFTVPGTNSTSASSFLTPPSPTDGGSKGLRDAAKRVFDGFNPDLDIHHLLQGIRLDEVITLSQSSSSIHTVQSDSSFPASFYIPLWKYVQYLWETWSNVVDLTIHNELPFLDWALTVLFSLITSVILFFGLVWCQFATNPFIYRLYFDWANRNAHGLGLVNAADPKLFNALTPEQSEAAKRKLGVSIEESVNSEDLRVFDYDIAKLLLQLASIVYERAPIAIHETLEEVTKAHRTSAAPTRTHMSAASSSARRCTVHRPPNANPDSPVHTPSPSSSGLHTPSGVHTVLESLPGELAKDIWGEDKAKKIAKAYQSALHNKGRSTIETFCAKIDIDYEPVSELNNSSSAFCSFFWDKNSNWIVVAFKGTGIVEYADWVTDLTTSFTDVSDFLPGYSKAIKGFKERLYPTNVSTLGGTRPWDSIRFSLCKVAESLAYSRAQAGQGGKINVWFTGHSLGCALATLAYARAISTPSDWAGYPIELRDCYIFAAPVSANRESAVTFNDRLAKFSMDDEATPAGHAHARTMWRVRNAGDAIATLLPQLGDRTDLASGPNKISPTNPAGFAHLGAEIVMKDSPHACGIVSPSDHFLGTPSDYGRSPTPVRVEVRSDFTAGEIKAQREKKFKENPGEKAREAFFSWAETIPLIGRFAAHDTVLYWDQLDRIALSNCVWAES
ncbi:alpha/beta-hydrolase [Clavulina sp. PMI_390]|nr:alpha/beta-hydrolase [Clavulina sp. PMI_390]